MTRQLQMTVILPPSFSSWLLAGLFHSGVWANVYISEDLCLFHSGVWANVYISEDLCLFHSGVWANVYISEDLCRTAGAGSPNPGGSVEHRLRTTGLTHAIDQPRQQRMISAAMIY